MGVTFGNRFLVQPQAASIVDDSQLANVNVDNSINIALIGEATGGTPNELLTFTDPVSLQRVMRGGDIVKAANRAFNASNQVGGAHRIVCIRANPATKSTSSISAGLDALAGSVANTIPGPWNLNPGDTLIVDVDGLGDLTATFDAVAALVAGTNASPFAFTAGDTLIINVDGAGNATATFDAGAAIVPATIAGPYVFTAADTIIVDIDGGGNATATFDAAAASRTSGSAETYNFTGGGQTLTVDVNGLGIQTVTFLVGDFATPAVATAAEVALRISTDLTGATAVDSGGSVVLTSDIEGTGSSLDVTGGTANALLSFVTGLISGTGDVVDIAAVTTAEIKTVVEADVAGAIVNLLSGNLFEITTTSQGTASTIQVDAGSTADGTTGLTNVLQAGTGDVADITAVTGSEVQTVVQADIPGVVVTLPGGMVTITSNTFGTASSIQVDTASTTEVILGLDTVFHAGSGDVANIDAVTPAEVKSIVEADIPTLTVELVLGDLLNLVSNTTGPASSIAVDITSTTDTIFGFDNALHVGAASTLIDVINLESFDFGLHTTNIQYSIEPGTVSGKKITVQEDDVIVVGDNIERESMQIQYIGTGSAATMSITDTTLSTTVTGGPGGEDLLISLADFTDISQLVNFIDGQAAYTAAVIDTNPNRALAFDFISGVDIQTSIFTALSDLQAIVDAFNGPVFNTLVTATKVVGVGQIPNDVANQFLAGGIEGTITNNEWQETLNTLQEADIKIFTLLTGNASVHDMGDAHAQFMSNVTGKQERRQIAGGENGEKDLNLTAWKQRALNLNSDRTALVPTGILDFDENGVEELIDPWFFAAQIAGMISGAGIGEPITRKFFNANGLADTLTSSEKDIALQSGLLIPEFEPGIGFRIVQGITTWLADDKFNKVEISTGMATDQISLSVRQALDSAFIGQKANSLVIAGIQALTETILLQLKRDEIIVGVDPNAENITGTPAFQNIQVTLVGDVAEVSFEASPVIPLNFILITVHAVPFTGTASV